MRKDDEEKEWQDLYESLKESLALIGREDAYGEGDYWIVDDDYGGGGKRFVCIQKIC